ncbi:MAG: hypothetical protein WA414_14390 [Acidobacteriaceae bacterium]
MKPINRRTFLAGGAAAGVLSGVDVSAALRSSATPPANQSGSTRSEINQAGSTAVDFRFAPADFQSTICFPDDPDKTVIGKRGDLRYDFPADAFASIDQFGTILEFTVAGMGKDTFLEQTMEAPSIPIVHTRLERGAVAIELIAFATRREGEGRVDNVLMEIRPKSVEVIASPLVRVRSCRKYKQGSNAGKVATIVREDEETPWLLCIPQNAFPGTSDEMPRVVEGGYELYLEHGNATPQQPLRYLFRIAQAGSTGTPATNIAPEQLLDEVRAWWRNWHAFGGAVDWALPGVNGDFLVACARNIQQAREVKDGNLVFEVGPTVYRGMWIVDGNFLLEAARYLGYDEAADKGLLSEWKHQTATGQIVASAGKEHWKDTAIAMFTVVRACELKQDWSLLQQLAPNIGHAIDFLISLRDEARKGDSQNGKYGLLAPGFPDGGMGGVHDEFTNTAWALAGLRAVARANQNLNIPDLQRAMPFYQELLAAFQQAARAEMVTDPRGFSYLPMIMREDPVMRDNAWERPRPQTCQWALSQTIFPGEVFSKDDPIVRGHIALMQACTQEDVPAETGWIHHEGLWNYNAPFVAEIYLWAGLRDWAHRTFTGYLNHASPLHAWREEQPLQHALIGAAWGDMPHNWASAECIRYLRHMLVLEDNRKLRLLEGLMPPDLQGRRPFSLTETPTRFGRISLTLEPSGTRGWKAHFVRKGNNAPESVEVRTELVPGLALTGVQGASVRKAASGISSIDPAATEWTATWGV